MCSSRNEHTAFGYGEMVGVPFLVLIIAVGPRDSWRAILATIRMFRRVVLYSLARRSAIVFAPEPEQPPHLLSPKDRVLWKVLWRVLCLWPFSLTWTLGSDPYLRGRFRTRPLPPKQYHPLRLHPRNCGLVCLYVKAVASPFLRLFLSPRSHFLKL